MAAEEGPPCTATTIGDFLVSSLPSGERSQPCTRYPSLFHVRLRPSPHSGRIPALACVRVVQAPIGPATTSCGCENEERTAALASPCFAAENFATTAEPRQRVRIFPEASSAAMPSSPSTYSVNRISLPERQKSADAEAFIPSVRFLGAPPAAGTVQMSPPVEPSSLMSPWITAISRPSGDHRGQAIWSGGFQMDFARPLGTSTV